MKDVDVYLNGRKVSGIAELEYDTQNKRVYVSGKIAGLDRDDAGCNFDSACKVLQQVFKHDQIVNPFDIPPFLGIKRWLFYMINDIRKQRKCTHSAFQSNWTDSRGAVIEYYFAKFVFRHKVIFL